MQLGGAEHVVKNDRDKFIIQLFTPVRCQNNDRRDAEYSGKCYDVIVVRWC